LVDLRGIEPLTSSMPRTRAGVGLFLPFSPTSTSVTTGARSGVSWWLKASSAPILPVRQARTSLEKAVWLSIWFDLGVTGDNRRPWRFDISSERLSLTWPSVPRGPWWRHSELLLRLW